MLSGRSRGVLECVMIGCVNSASSNSTAVSSLSNSSPHSTSIFQLRVICSVRMSWSLAEAHRQCYLHVHSLSSASLLLAPSY